MKLKENNALDQPEQHHPIHPWGVELGVGAEWLVGTARLLRE